MIKIKSMFQKQSRIRGFSFVEIILATFVLIFGLLAILSIIDVNNHNNKKASRRAMAAHFAKMKSAEIEASGFDRVSKLIGNKKELSLPAKGSEAFKENPSFRWAADFFKSDGNSVNYVVSVNWSEVSYKEKKKGEAVPKTKSVEFLGFIQPEEAAK